MPAFLHRRFSHLSAIGLAAMAFFTLSSCSTGAPDPAQPADGTIAGPSSGSQLVIEADPSIEIVVGNGLRAIQPSMGQITSNANFAGMRNQLAPTDDYYEIEVTANDPFAISLTGLADDNAALTVLEIEHASESGSSTSANGISSLAREGIQLVSENTAESNGKLVIAGDGFVTANLVGSTISDQFLVISATDAQGDVTRVGVSIRVGNSNEAPVPVVPSRPLADRVIEDEVIASTESSAFSGVDVEVGKNSSGDDILSVETFGQDGLLVAQPSESKTFDVTPDNGIEIEQNLTSGSSNLTVTNGANLGSLSWNYGAISLKDHVKVRMLPSRQKPGQYNLAIAVDNNVAAAIETELDGRPMLPAGAITDSGEVAFVFWDSNLQMSTIREPGAPLIRQWTGSMALKTITFRLSEDTLQGDASSTETEVSTSARQQVLFEVENIDPLASEELLRVGPLTCSVTVGEGEPVIAFGEGALYRTQERIFNERTQRMVRAARQEGIFYECRATSITQGFGEVTSVGARTELVPYDPFVATYKSGGTSKFLYAYESTDGIKMKVRGKDDTRYFDVGSFGNVGAIQPKIVTREINGKVVVDLFYQQLTVNGYDLLVAHWDDFEDKRGAMITYSVIKSFTQTSRTTVDVPDSLPVSLVNKRTWSVGRFGYDVVTKEDLIYVVAYQKCTDWNHFFLSDLRELEIERDHLTARALTPRNLGGVPTPNTAEHNHQLRKIVIR